MKLCNGDFIKVEKSMGFIVYVGIDDTDSNRECALPM